MIRSFLAIDLPPRQKEEVCKLLNELAGVPSQVKWVSADQLHLTLKFFGSIAPETVERISQTLAPIIARHPPFRLTLQEWGGFPHLLRPRVIWLGVGGETQNLLQLHQAVEEALASIGIPREERPFKGHLTLGRNKGSAIDARLAELLKRKKWTETPLFDIEEVVLFRSDLKPSGPIYTRLKVFPLNGPSTGKD